MRSRYKSFTFYFPRQVVECVNRHPRWRVVAVWREGYKWNIEFDPIIDTLSEAAWLKKWRYDYPLDFVWTN